MSEGRAPQGPPAGPIERLMAELGRLPGVGEKTAERMAFHLLRRPPEEARALAEAIRDVADRIRSCGVCCNLSETDPCPICADPRRDSALVCVVEGIPSLLAFERTAQYRGVYHVLHGTLSPLEGVGPDDLRIAELLRRVEQGGLREIILATNPDAEGEATGVYLSRALKPTGVRVTRLATGLPIGGDVKYTDKQTLAKSLEGRRDV